MITEYMFRIALGVIMGCITILYFIEVIPFLNLKMTKSKKDYLLYIGIFLILWGIFFYGIAVGEIIYR